MTTAPTLATKTRNKIVIAASALAASVMMFGITTTSSAGSYSGYGGYGQRDHKNNNHKRYYSSGYNNYHKNYKSSHKSYSQYRWVYDHYSHKMVLIGYNTYTQRWERCDHGQHYNSYGQHKYRSHEY
jgi:hypothetical protein